MTTSLGMGNVVLSVEVITGNGGWLAGMKGAPPPAPLELDELEELDVVAPLELELVEVDPLPIPFGAELHALATSTKPSPIKDRIPR
jgi:hypothetical protein